MRAQPPTQETGAPIAGRTAAKALLGRVVDAASGAGVRGARLQLLPSGPEVVSDPSGSFIFESPPAGVATLEVRAAERYLTLRLAVELSETQPLDLGELALQAIGPAQQVDPARETALEGCGLTSLRLPAHALPRQVELRLSCIEQAESLPLEAPPGRLPLSVVDIAPADAGLVREAELTFQLPSQPRYSPGTRLDVLVASAEAWQLVGQAVIDEQRPTASARITSLGTFMLAGPPFGTFRWRLGQPRVSKLGVATRPGGETATDLPSQSVIYSVLEYRRTYYTRLTLRTLNSRQRVVFEQTRPYVGDGLDSVPMLFPGQDWPPDSYTTSVFIDGEPDALATLQWRVGAAVASGSTSSTPQRCAPRQDWLPYVVRSGDTLSGLAEAAGISVADLMRGNCRQQEALFADETILLPP